MINVRFTIKHGRNVKTTVVGTLETIDTDATNDEIVEAALVESLIDEVDSDFIKKIERLTDAELADAENLEEDEDEETEEESDDAEDEDEEE